MPLVSMSERRLMEMAYSGLRWRSAIFEVAASTSRTVRPSCSRKARNCWPGSNMGVWVSLYIAARPRKQTLFHFQNTRAARSAEAVPGLAKALEAAAAGAHMREQPDAER